MNPEVIYLDLQDALAIADLLGVAGIRDAGLLDAALHRPSANAFGRDAYLTLPTKAAAMFESLVRNHPLVDGNQRLAWTATIVFLRLNGVSLSRPDDDIAYRFVVDAASGALSFEQIVAVWESWTLT